MDWANETWRKLYVRETVNWSRLSWEARGVYLLLLKACDGFGRVELGAIGLEGIGYLLRAPWREIEASVRELLEIGYLRLSGSGVELVGFEEAQRTPAMSGSERQQRWREKQAQRKLEGSVNRPTHVKVAQPAAEWFTGLHSVTEHAGQVVESIQVRNESNERNVTRNGPSTRNTEERREEKRRKKIEALSTGVDRLAGEGASEAQSKQGEAIKLVFDYWARKTNRKRVVLDAKRKRIIQARLREGFTVDDLCKAVDGCTLSEFHQGENERKHVYDGIELIMRDAQHIEDFSEMADTARRQGDIKRLHLTEPLSLADINDDSE
jgi:uncharacterized phage protein (TIGR02220 family)